jgi:serine/threonine protein phosphatase 1
MLGALVEQLSGQGRLFRAYPPCEPGIVIYVVGDVHGRDDCLVEAHARIERDARYRARGRRVIEVYLGDLIDRGPQSAAVVARILRRAGQRDIIVIKGNHEILFADFLRGELDYESFKKFGGRETLLSYGLDPMDLRRGGQFLLEAASRKVPKEHIKLFEIAPLSLRLGDYLFVHAGVRPGIPIDRQISDDLAWIRDDFLTHDGDFGAIVVHGHTPVPRIDFRPNRINVDTGAYATRRLSVLVIDDLGPAEID